MHLVFKHNKFRNLMLIVFSILIAVLPAIITSIEAFAIDALLGKIKINELNNFSMFLIFIVFIAFLEIVILISNYFWNSLYNKNNIYFSKSVARDFINQYKNVSAGEIKKYSSADAYNHVIHNSDNYYFNRFISLVNIITSVIFIIILIIIFSINSWITLIIFIIVSIIISIPNIVSFKNTQSGIESGQKAFNDLIDKTNELLEGYSQFYFNNKTHLVENFLAKYIYEFYFGSYQGSKMEVKNKFFSKNFIEILEYTGVIVLLFIYSQNYFNVSIGSVYIFRKALSTNATTNLFNLFTNIRTYYASKNLETMFDLKIEQDKKTIKTIDLSEINLKNLTYKVEDKIILNNFNYSFKKGKKYLIIGESGSGKSTILQLILGNIDNYEGKIEFTNVDIKNIKDSAIKEHISYLDSSGFVYDDNIYNNLSLGKAKLEKANKILKFLNLDPELEEEIKDKNFDSFNNLSISQKQRLAFARLLYFDKDYLLLDESFSNVNKEQFEELLEKIIKTDKTIIYISHQLEDKDKKHFDFIIDFDQINKKMQIN
ncbi:ABC transporter ATP-binding protein [Mesomycoplasma lagogenitalium]|uniref:ABC transporter ATP-binding protein n=1 Tax=Mesomycoplasma lagogenitalium TaxID=171286 RepID=A0ABY8LTB7_9BACT|nr:ABC transporter ATP-binding protein [Mesomycoplasma lagogenitalium]WGI36494.1 ABC transporter ATP-binding protein [Mesomycoplasma lagogenitalium]